MFMTLWPITLPHDASESGHRVDGILKYLIISTSVAFAVMAIVLVVAVMFHRGPSRAAHYTHGAGLRDRLVAAAVGLLVLFGIDAVAVVRTQDDLRSGFWKYPDSDPRAVRVEVTGQQWAWTFRHPGADGLFGTRDDLVTLNELRVPLGRPVYLQLTSKDVVHSFYLPNFRNKIDAIPGSVTRLWFEPREPGVFEIACAQHCGAWHYKMRAELTVMSADGFARWARRAAADAPAAPPPPPPSDGGGDSGGVSGQVGKIGQVEPSGGAWTWVARP